MSPYLLAFLVSDFDYTMNEEENNYKIWHEKSKGAEAHYAVNIAPKIVHFYEDYFSLKYPLPKLDFAAVLDFGGAMENWGLIVFNRDGLLLDEENSGAMVKQSILKVMAHEIGHQWFGDIVTIKWWNDFWLNEGQYLI